MTRNITPRQAQAVLNAVKAQNKAYLQPILREDGSVLVPAPEGPTLIMDFDFLGHGPAPAIVWEEGPAEWAMRVHSGGLTEEERVLLHEAAEEFGGTVTDTGPKPANLPPSVWTEPITSWALGIYPA